MQDLIDRQTAIDAVEKWLFDTTDLRQPKEVLCCLPSAQPEPLTDKEQNELISRQAAIDAINNAFDRETLLTGFVRSVAIRAIREMPSAHRLHITGYIPEAWIENEIKWLRGVGNHFAALTAMNIEAMLKRWREQQESEEDKDGCGR